MPLWRRRESGPPPPAPPPEPAVPAVPTPPAVPAEAQAVADRLLSCGVTPGALQVVGVAGPLTVWGWHEDGAAAVGRWRELRAVHERTGLWPVLLGPAAELGETSSLAGGDHEDGAVEEGLGLSAEQVLARLADEADSDDGPLHEQPRLPDVLEELPEALQVSGAPTLLGLVPASAGWEVPALLSWQGAANADISPAEHLAVLRRWQQRHGAELVALGFDTLELTVDRPPTAAGEVVAVARELYAYCPDVVDQGAGTLESLCREVVPGRAWSFWWD